jgi:predicted transglutaminase-like cysteine proteinase
MVRCLSSRAPILAALAILMLFSGASGGAEVPLFTPVGRPAPVPIGWPQFCTTYAAVCDTRPSTPRDIVLSGKAWSDLNRLNTWVNHNIQPMTDMDHYGMIQWWRYPDDGIGSCHSYALLKRKMLMDAGWPREALLMTIVHLDFGRGEGHAVITVKTNRGELILDNLTDEILPWSKTTYRFYKRQSQADPNAWVWLHDPRAESAISLVQTGGAQ